MTPTDKLELQVAEEADGSAVVQMPQNDNDEPSKASASSQNEDSDASDEAQRPQNDEDEDIQDDDPEREALRAARREERKLKKQLHREKARESNHLITALRKQNQELAQRVATLETKTSGAELARLDKAIDDAQTRVEYAKMKLQDAVNSRNGEEVTKAQQLWYDNQRQLESLQSLKTNATKHISQPKQHIKGPDPMVQRMAATWMERNGWYDPQLKDPDSKVAQSIDQSLTEEGFDPSLADYWDELDERLQKYLPHRYNSGYSSNTKTSRPRSVVTSSGRDAAPSVRANEFRVDPDRVRALKEAGMWDNVELRNKMIRKFAEFDRQQKKG
jgi:hypothetical protein